MRPEGQETDPVGQTRGYSIATPRFFSFFFFVPRPTKHMEFPCQGSEPGIKFEPKFRPKPQLQQQRAGSSTHCAGLGIKSMSQHSQDTHDPVAPQRELWDTPPPHPRSKF